MIDPPRRKSEAALGGAATRRLQKRLTLETYTTIRLVRQVAILRAILRPFSAISFLLVEAIGLREDELANRYSSSPVESLGPRVSVVVNLGGRA
jgi:hypothetical protein